jgi:flagellin
MAPVINTNIASLNAQRNLNGSQSSLQTSLTRLSSGLRINSAKDDAAGLAISERFTTQIRGMDVAIRNANDGISLAQTAEGAMAEIGNNLQRVREMSVQSANYTNSTTDRQALQAEVQQLVAEIDRVANQTNFNGTNLLDGSFAGALFQVGPDAGQTIGLNNIVDANADALGRVRFAAEQAATTGAADAESDGQLSGMEINGIVINDITWKEGATGKEVANAVANGINDKLDLTGVYAKVDDAGAITLISVRANKDFEFTAGTITGGGPLGADATEVGLTGIADTGGTPILAADSPAVTAKDLDITSFEGAQQALEVVDKALTDVNAARAEMGAVQNRFESVIANLSATAENMSASRSRIMDADFAKETAELTRSQILQQAGTAMLAQANSLPQNVLSLLR